MKLANLKWDLVFLFGVIVLYFILRLPNLTDQPIFADEAIYIRWAQVMRAEPTLRFLPLSDGKTPLFMWAMIPLFKVFTDPLYAGRFLSILSGLGTLIGIYLVSRIFFNKQAAFITTFIVATNPLMVFFDRMALVDSMLAAFCIWSLLFALLLTKFMRIDLSFVLGYLLGGSILTKPPGFFNILVLPTTLLLFDWRGFERTKRFIKLFLMWVVAIFTALFIYNILRLGPGFSNLSSRSQDYVHSPSRLLEYPLDPFIPHLRDLQDWLPKLLTIPVFALLLIGLVYPVFQRNKVSIVIALWALIPLALNMALLKTFTARYILFSIPPLIILAVDSFIKLTAKIRLSKVFLGIFLISYTLLAGNFVFRLLFDPATAPLPKEERRGYLEDWTAGYGLKDIATFLQQEASKQPVVVGTEGYFGTLPDGLFIYLDKVPNLAIVGGGATVSGKIYQSAKEHPTYFVSNKSRISGATNLNLLKEYPKAFSPGHIKDAILLFKVEPLP